MKFVAALALLGVFATLGATQLEGNVSLPIEYEAKILMASEVPGECPSSAETRTEIRAEIGQIIQDYVLPNVSVEPTVPTYVPPCCGEDASGWQQVAYINMSDPSTNCPEEFVYYATPKRSCGRGGDFKGCLSTYFSVNSQSYSKVCGRIIGYQYGGTVAFHSSVHDIDARYISGVSLTYGSSPRQHIWSFAAALGHSYTYDWNCPCTSIGYTSTVDVPDFIEGSYFCETAVDSYTGGTFYPDNPLWDGEGCKDTSTCCELNNPPWFCQTLPESTTEDIELRICTTWNSQLEDTPLELIELHIK